MFTGIVEMMGRVESLTDVPDHRLLIVTSEQLEQLPIGASIAVNGVCLTVVETAPGSVSLDVITETLDRTNLGELTVGAPVNLERPMQANGRFDGHMVQGHVDGVGTITSLATDEQGTIMEIAAPSGLTRYLVEKGSVAVDGVSLTIASLHADRFSIALIPHTLAVTTLGLRRAGDTVNLECDVVAKYVEKAVESLRPA